MRLFLILVAAIGCVSSEFGNDFFIQYVNSHLDDSVPPCDNFYRHVCARKTQTTDGLVYNALTTVYNWIDEGAKKIQQHRNYTFFEKNLLSLEGKGGIHSAHEKLPAELKTDLVLRGAGVADLYLTMMRRMRFVNAVPDIHMFAPRQFMHEIIEMAEKEIEVSDSLFTPETKERFRETLSTLNTERYDEYTSSTYESIFANLDVFFKATGALDRLNESNVHSLFGEFLTVLGSYGFGLLNLRPLTPTVDLLYRRHEMHAEYEDNGNYLLLLDATLIMSIDAFTPAKYGSAGFIMAHEMFHSILRNWHWTSDVKLGQHSVCLASHMENVCKVFQEGDCVSGAVTYDEDSADMEATQLLFKMMRNKLGVEMKEVIAGTTVTNDQMFFYANAMFNCEREDENGDLNHPKSDEYPSGWDSHSYGIPRVNGPLSLMNAFHEAFNCKAGDRMIDIAVGREGCNAFGDPVRA